MQIKFLLLRKLFPLCSIQTIPNMSLRSPRSTSTAFTADAASVMAITMVYCVTYLGALEIESSRTHITTCSSGLVISQQANVLIPMRHEANTFGIARVVIGEATS